MADNYIERRIEEYRSGRLKQSKRVVAGRISEISHRDALTLRFPPMMVIILANTADAVVEAAVRAFSGVGCKVAFTCDDERAGNRLAQSSGARYYPASFTSLDIVDDAERRWGMTPDVAVVFDNCKASGREARVVDVECCMPDVSQSGIDPSVTARHLLYLSHPENAFLLRIG